MISQVFNYEGSGITFRKNGKLMVNATEMAKRFGKQPIGWLRTQETDTYLSELSKLRNCSLADLVQVNKGGNNPGTWFHEDVALEFARWLSPSFAIWCNDRIKELLQYGETSLQPQSEDELILQAISTLQGRVEVQKAQIKQLETHVFQQDEIIELQTKEIETLLPDAQYTQDVLKSANTFTATQIAKELGCSAETLNKKLNELGVQYKQNGQWLLYHKYQNKNYTQVNTYTQILNKGTDLERIRTYHSTVWTEKGRKFIHDIIKNKALA